MTSRFESTVDPNKKILTIMVISLLISMVASQSITQTVQCSTIENDSKYFPQKVTCGACVQVTGNFTISTFSYDLYCSQCNFLAPNKKPFSEPGLANVEWNIGHYGCTWTNGEFFLKNWWLSLLAIIFILSCVVCMCVVHHNRKNQRNKPDGGYLSGGYLSGPKEN